MKCIGWYNNTVVDRVPRRRGWLQFSALSTAILLHCSTCWCLFLSSKQPYEAKIDVDMSAVQMSRRSSSAFGEGGQPVPIQLEVSGSFDLTFVFISPSPLFLGKTRGVRNSFFLVARMSCLVYHLFHKSQMSKWQMSKWQMSKWQMSKWQMSK